ncbi:MAG: hypothetical protein AAGA99_21000 [Actinomycetota bacterium]
MEHVADPEGPIACTLSPDAATSQLGEWDRLAARATTCEPVTDGWSLTFPAALAPVVEDLASREAACCSFLTLRTTVEGDDVRLDITTEASDARQVIDLLVGKG